MTVNTAHAVVFAGLMPHAPIIVPEVARGREAEVARTIDAMERCAARLVASGADALVLVSPHSPRRRGSFGIWKNAQLGGSFAAFGAPRARVELPLDKMFAESIENHCAQRGIVTWDIAESDLDHGALVPLYYIQKAGWRKPSVVVGLNYPGEGQLEEIGKAIASAAEELGRRVAILASGDMSHRLMPSAPGGFHPRAQEFDDTFVDLVAQGRYDSIRRFDGELQSLAGEDVVDSSIVALAAASFDGANHELLNYEGPFGVGYTVAVFCDHASERSHEEEPLRDFAILPRFAREAVELWVREQRVLCPNIQLEGRLAQRGAVFVTIRRKNGDLRGCIGNLHPEKTNVVEETIDRAITTARSDVRFEPIAKQELNDLIYTVSVLHQPELVISQEELDPAKYGIIITDRRGRRAVMLPGIETLDTVEKQLAATKRKAGIPPDEEVTIERFEVEKLEELV